MTTLKRILVIALAVVMVACIFTACSSEGANGTYSFIKASRKVVDKDGTERIVDVTAEMTGLKLKLKLDEGDKATITVNGVEDTGSWEMKDDKIVVSGGESVYEFTVDGDSLLLIDGDVTITLTK